MAGGRGRERLTQAISTPARRVSDRNLWFNTLNVFYMAIAKKTKMILTNKPVGVPDYQLIIAITASAGTRTARIFLLT
ncbi:MAG: hypothetical protein AB4062_07170 [Crocosphaera sp.]